MPTENKWLPENKAKSAGITKRNCGANDPQPLLPGRSMRYLCSRDLHMDMNHHFCILPTEASRENHETSAQRFTSVSISMAPSFTIWKGSLEETPKFCLVSCWNHVKPQVLKNSEVKLWISDVHWQELFNLQAQRCQLASSRAFKHPIFSIERLIFIYTTLVCRIK